MSANTTPTATNDANHWQSRWSTLTAGNAWLKQKLDRPRRLREHTRYLLQYAPEFFAMPSGIVLDFGPGGGELLEIAAGHGHLAIGVDSPIGEGGMGDDYLEACQLMWERHCIAVMRCGGLEFLRRMCVDGEKPIPAGKCCLINFRGSLEQVFSRYMAGEPHHKHHRADQMAWREGSATDLAMCQFGEAIDRLLCPGGVLLIHANGSKNHDYAFATLNAVMSIRGLEEANMGEGVDSRVMKWRRVV